MVEYGRQHCEDDWYSLLNNSTMVRIKMSEWLWINRNPVDEVKSPPQRILSVNRLFWHGFYGHLLIKMPLLTKMVWHGGPSTWSSSESPPFVFMVQYKLTTQVWLAWVVAGGTPHSTCVSHWHSCNGKSAKVNSQYLGDLLYYKEITIYWLKI